MVRKNIHLTEEQIERLKKMSLGTGIVVARLIRIMIDDCLDTYEKAQIQE